MTKSKSATSKATVAKTKASVATTSKSDWSSSKSAYTSSKSSTNAVSPKINTASAYTGNTRTVVINRYNNSYGGYYYNDPYDHSLISGFSTLWWYHHWSTIDRSHYDSDDAKFKELEAEVAKLKAEGIAPDPDYVEEGMDTTVMYSEGYMQGVKDGTITENAFEATDLTTQTVDENKGMCFIGLVAW